MARPLVPSPCFEQPQSALAILLKPPKLRRRRASLREKALAARGRLETGGGREKRDGQSGVLATGFWVLAIVDF